MLEAVGADGRTRHVVSIDEKLVAREERAVVAGQRVELRRGPHAGRLGRIAEVHPRGARDGAATANVTLQPSGAVIRGVHEDDLILLCGQCKLGVWRARSHYFRNLITPRFKADYETRLAAAGKDGGARRDRDAGEPAAKRALPTPPSSSSSSSAHHASSSSAAAWLHRHLRVRIISDRVAHGKLYNQKVVVQDVVTPELCSVLTDEGRLVEEVKQKYLETVIPKAVGSIVLVVVGRHKGRRGKLLNVRGVGGWENKTPLINWPNSATRPRSKRWYSSWASPMA